MYSPPFHRRILPWIFVIVFIITAPLLVLYTAGYRWNSKKERVERNGTLILETQPRRARVLLNNRDTEEVTPVTLQNVAPGNYLVRFEKDGYFSWEKHLDIRPQFATFANTVWLWRQATPETLTVSSLPKTAATLASSPNQKDLALVTAGASSTVVILGTDDFPVYTAAFTRPLQPPLRLRWSETSRYLLVEDSAPTGSHAWLINPRITAVPVALPSAVYEWQDNDLIGITATTTIVVRGTDFSIQEKTRLKNVASVYGDMQLTTRPGTDELIYLDRPSAKRGIILPKGNWHIVNTNGPRLLFRDGDAWLSLDPNGSAPRTELAHGTDVQPFPAGRTTTYLLQNNGEVWTWNPTEEPVLIERESAPPVRVLWHQSGLNILLVEKTTVSMLELDERDGREKTTLATFDRIDDAALLGDTLYVSGARGGDAGLWKMELQ